MSDFKNKVKKVLKKDFSFPSRPGMERLDSKGRTYFSASSLDTFARCPVQYELRYIDEIKKPSSLKMEFGTAMHGALQYNNEHMIQFNNTPADLEEVLEAFRILWKEGQVICERTEEDESPEVYEKDGIDMLTKYMKEVAKNTFPQKTEVKFDLMLDDDLHIAGFIDKIDNDVIVDYKCGSKSFSQEEVDLNTQLTMYSAAYRKQEGKIEEGVAVEQLYRSTAKTKREERHSIKTHLSRRLAEDIERLKYRMRKAKKLILNGIFMPADNYMVCSWCSFREECKNKCKTISAPKFISA